MKILSNFQSTVIDKQVSPLVDKPFIDKACLVDKHIGPSKVLYHVGRLLYFTETKVRNVDY